MTTWDTPAVEVSVYATSSGRPSVWAGTEIDSRGAAAADDGKIKAAVSTASRIPFLTGGTVADH
jgi:hypothetical protein